MIEGVGARTAELETVAADVAAHFEGVFAVLERMRLALVEAFERGPVDAELAARIVHPLAKNFLDHGVALGCGYVAARDALSDRALYLAWWQGEDQQLLGQADAPAGDPLDYTRREWFRVPAATGERHVTGPYVDYICTDEYVVTATLPVIVDGRLLGVVGADHLVETLEDLLLTPLRRAGASLLSAQGRLIASADHRLQPGELVEAGADVVPCGTLPMLVAPAHGAVRESVSA